MAFDQRHGSLAIASMATDLSSGQWVIGAFPEIVTDSYDLDHGVLTVYKYDAGMTAKAAADYWYGKSVPQYPTMYVTNVSAKLIPGNIWQADLTIMGCISRKQAKLSNTTSLKEMTVTHNDSTLGFNAVTPSFTLEYLSGPGVSVTPPILPSAPGGFWFFGPAKYNQPYGWVMMDASTEYIEGTPFMKTIESYQWIHSAEPASGS